MSSPTLTQKLSAEALGTAILVAVCVELNANGQYEARSFYPVSETKVQNRLAKGFLCRVQKC